MPRGKKGRRGEHLRGRRLPGSGRKKGSLNKYSKFTRDFMQNLLDKNVDLIQAAFEKVLRKDPKTGVRLASDLAEYCTPKLAKVESTVVVKKELRDYSDEEIVALLTERNAARAKPGEARGPAVPETKH